MFDNISQSFVFNGAMGYLILVPILRFLATLFMAISTYKLLKARQDRHKFLWVVAICISPIIARIAFEVYRHVIAKKEINTAKGSKSLLIASIVAFVLAAILMVVSVISMGVGYLKSEIDGEPLGSFYDVHGNAYDDLYDVPLYDEQGNRYTYQAALFTGGTYTDQNGNAFDGEYCYLGEDGYLYYDENRELKPYQDSLYYYTDGEMIYYSLLNRVYWDADGTIYEKSGRFHLELFDFPE